MFQTHFYLHYSHFSKGFTGARVNNPALYWGRIRLSKVFEFDFICDLHVHSDIRKLCCRKTNKSAHYPHFQRAPKPPGTLQDLESFEHKRTQGNETELSYLPTRPNYIFVDFSRGLGRL